MHFINPKLQVAWDSEEIQRLSDAAEALGSDISPQDELYRLDCWPEVVTDYGEQMQKSATLLAEAKKNIDAAEKKLRSWKGSAGQAFRTRCGKLLWACEQARNRATNQAKEGAQIAAGLDKLVSSTALQSRVIAKAVQSDSTLVGSRIPLPEDERRRAEENVRNALKDLHTMVNVQVSRIPPLGDGLNDLRVPRR